VRRTLLSSANSAFILGPAGAAGFAPAAGRSSRLPGPPGGLGGGGGGGPPLALGALPGAGALAAPAAGAEAAKVYRLYAQMRRLWLAAAGMWASPEPSTAGPPGQRPPEACLIFDVLEHVRLMLSCGRRQGCNTSSRAFSATPPGDRLSRHARLGPPFFQGSPPGRGRAGARTRARGAGLERHERHAARVPDGPGGRVLGHKAPATARLPQVRPARTPPRVHPKQLHWLNEEVRHSVPRARLARR